MEITKCLELLLEFPRLLLSTLTFKLVLPLYVLRHNQDDIPSEEVENVMYLGPFLKFVSLPLFTFKLCSLLLL